MDEYVGGVYELKSLKILYNYIINASEKSDTLELFTAWKSEED